MSPTTVAAFLMVAFLAALTTASPVPADPLPSLKHDTDVVRLARPNRRMFLVDLIQPPASTADPLQTNEVDTSADSDLPRIVRVLIPDPNDDVGADDEDYQPKPVSDDITGLDAVSVELGRLKPPAEDQLASAAVWGDSPVASAPASPSLAEELVPPPAAQPDVSEWTQQSAQPAQPAQPRSDSVPVSEAVREPSDELQPPSASATGVWELFEAIKMAMADEATAAASEAREATVVKDVREPASDLLPPAVDNVNFWNKQAEIKAEARSDDASVNEPEERPSEPATDLVPPPVGEPNLSAWTKQESAASDAAPAKLAAPVNVVPEPASFLVPPSQDSYMPETPSSGEARPDDFLSLGTAPPQDAAVEFIKEHSDSYLPEAGELKALAEGPIVDDFLAIGEPPKEDAAGDKTASKAASSEEDAKSEPKQDAKDSYMPQADSKEDVKDSYMPQPDSKEDVKDSYMPQADSKDDAKDSYMPQADSKEDAKDSYMPQADSKEDVKDSRPTVSDSSVEDSKDLSSEPHQHEVHASTEEKDDEVHEVDDDDADGEEVVSVPESAEEQGSSEKASHLQALRRLRRRSAFRVDRH